MPVVTIVVAGSCVGLVLIFLAVLLIMMCYICRKSRQKNGIANHFCVQLIIMGGLISIYSQLQMIQTMQVLLLT